MKIKEAKAFVSVSAGHLDKLRTALNAKRDSPSKDKARCVNTKHDLLIRMIIETGCRPSEALLSLKKDYWETANCGRSRVFTIPGNKTKTGFAHSWKFISSTGV